MIAVMLSVAAMASSVAVAVASSAQTSAAERRARDSAASAVKNAKAEMEATVAKANSAATEGAARLKTLEENQAGANQKIEDEVLPLIATYASSFGDELERLKEDSLPGLSPHVTFKDNKVEIVSSAGANLYAGRKSFVKEGNQTYVRGGSDRGDVNVGDDVTKTVKIGHNLSTPVHIGFEQTSFNVPDADGSERTTTINPTLGGNVYVAQSGSRARGGFHAAGAFSKPLGSSDATMRGENSKIVVGKDGAEITGKPRTVVRGDRMEVLTDKGICFGPRDSDCMTQEKIGAIVGDIYQRLHGIDGQGAMPQQQQQQGPVVEEPEDPVDPPNGLPAP